MDERLYAHAHRLLQTCISPNLPSQMVQFPMVPSPRAGYSRMGPRSFDTDSLETCSCLRPVAARASSPRVWHTLEVTFSKSDL
jgi:hypothetical protein